MTTEPWWLADDPKDIEQIVTGFLRGDVVADRTTATNSWFVNGGDVSCWSCSKQWTVSSQDTNRAQQCSPAAVVLNCPHCETENEFDNTSIAGWKIRHVYSGSIVDAGLYYRPVP